MYLKKQPFPTNLRSIISTNDVLQFLIGQDGFDVNRVEVVGLLQVLKLFSIIYTIVKVEQILEKQDRLTLVSRNLILLNLMVFALLQYKIDDKTREFFIHGKAMVPYVQLSTNCGLDNFITVQILFSLY